MLPYSVPATTACHLHLHYHHHHSSNNKLPLPHHYNTYPACNSYNPLVERDALSGALHYHIQCDRALINIRLRLALRRLVRRMNGYPRHGCALAFTSSSVRNDDCLPTRRNLTPCYFLGLVGGIVYLCLFRAMYEYAQSQFGECVNAERTSSRVTVSDHQDHPWLSLLRLGQSNPCLLTSFKAFWQAMPDKVLQVKRNITALLARNRHTQ